MAEVTLESAPQKARDFFEKGNAALQKANLDYAMDMFMAALDIEPKLLKARIALKAATIQAASARGKKLFGSVSGLGGMAKITALVAKKPLEALKEAEKLLRTNPTNLTFIKILDQAAIAADLPEAAAIAYEAAKSANPKSIDLYKRLGQLYQEMGDSNKSKNAFEQLVALKPNDQRFLKMLKDASALDTMQSGGWDNAGSYRDVMKDEKEAELLEQESRSTRSTKGMDDLIKETLAKVEREPENLNYKRALADLYTKEQRFEEALEILQVANDLVKGADPEIDRAITTTQEKHFDAYIAQLREEGQNDEADQAEAEKKAFIFQTASDRVQRYPNDLQLKYELAVLHFDRGELNEAIHQLQLAQRNPQRRILSLYYLARCFKAKNQFDIAAEQLEKACEELPVMDDTKKDVLYELGLTYEAMKDFDKATKYYKELYAVDISYRDVADKIEKGLQA